MIHYTKGDLFESQTEALVNTVNTVGVMGKGIALQFKQRFPENFEAYKQACDAKLLDIGGLLTTRNNSLFHKFIINFPTKTHWLYPSKYLYIEKGLETLVKTIGELNIKSIALPPLGVGNGKLDWEQVKILLEKHLSVLKDVDVYVYEPQVIFNERDNKSSQETVKITPIRALLLQAFNEFDRVDNSLNLLVTQKLAYFLQRFGEPLRLEYTKGWYGPYAANLNKVLQVLNGVYINYQAQYDKPSTPIVIVREKYPEVEAVLLQLSDKQKQRANDLQNFIQGFETPFSLELLATVDWILQQSPNLKPIEIHQEITNWTKRKANLIKLYHVEVAYNRLQEFKQKLYKA